MKINLIKLRLVILFVALVGAFLVFGSDAAFAATKTWTGGGSDNKFSTSANWSPSGAPVAGDALQFNNWTITDVGVSNGRTLNNDIDAIFSNAIATSAASTDPTGNDVNVYSINTIKLAGGSAPISSGVIRLGFDKIISSGEITLGPGITVDEITAGSVVADRAAAIYKITSPSLFLASGTDLVTAVNVNNQPFVGLNNLTIQNGAKLNVLGEDGSVLNLPSNITLGGGSGASPEIIFARGAGGPGSPTQSPGVVFSGAITLESNAIIRLTNNVVRMSNTLTDNGFKLQTVLSGSKSYLKGTGLAGGVSVGNGSTISPGNSPGILSTEDLEFEEGGIYEFEIAGNDDGQFDQINVTGVVSLGNGTLKTILLDGFKPEQGKTFVIINNDGTDAVEGTFAGLAEGATVEVDGVGYFTISYTGGDGNDVTLTAIPGVSDTGAKDTSAQTGLVVLGTVGAGVVLQQLNARTKLFKKRR